MYFLLSADLGLHAGYVEAVDVPDVSLICGITLGDEQSLPHPWRFTIEPNPNRALIMSAFYSGKHLMHQRLVDTLRAAGVDNLQVFSAEITNVATQEVIRDYVVVNVIGLVSCVDDLLSESSLVADSRYFHRLVIDRKRTNSLLLFRLAESPIELIIDESVAKDVYFGDFVDIKLVPLDESM